MRQEHNGIPEGKTVGIINWLARKVAARIEIPPAPAPLQPRIDLNLALENLIGKGLVERTTADMEFIKVMADIKTKSVMQALGSQGGKERARRARERQVANPTWCPVCAKRRELTDRPVLKWHMNGHAGARPALPQTSGGPREQSPKAPRPEGLDSASVVRPESAPSTTDDAAKGGSGS